MNNDSLDPLELELRRLRPAAVDPELARAIAAELEPPRPPATAAGVARHAPAEETPLRRLRQWLWVSRSVAAAAAVVAILALLRQPPARADFRPGGDVPLAAQASPANTTSLPGSAAADTLRVVPVGSAGYLFGAQDEGLVRLDDGMTARRVRLQYLDTFQLSAPEGHGTVNISYPREEIRVIPITTL